MKPLRQGGRIASPEDAVAAVGLTVKSGWAVAVLVSGAPDSPRLADTRRIDLSDPELPESRQPYHASFGTARASGAELTRLLRAVRRYGTRSVAEVIRQYRSAWPRLAGAGVVVGSLIDPERIANAHIRIHALEGQLFRRVVEDALRANGVSQSVWRERDLYGIASGVLKQTEQRVRATVTALADRRAGAWRAEHKAAAVAAWAVLTSSADATR